MGDAQLSRDDAGPNPSRSHFDDLQANVVGQGTPIDEHATQLVDPTLSCRGEGNVVINFPRVNYLSIERSSGSERRIQSWANKLVVAFV